MDYEPASGTELPSYFYAMLDDVDRALQYMRAINACIRDLRQALPDKDYPIVVVDVGVGTGMLSAFALLAGADVVIGVDVNLTAINAAEAAIKAISQAEDNDMASRFVSVPVTLQDSTAQDIRSKIDAKLEEQSTQLRHVKERTLLFDVVISELIGTLVFGESMEAYIAPYIELTREHSGRLFVVPEVCTQYFGVYDFRSAPDCLRFAIEHVLDANPERYFPTDSRGLGVPLYLHDPVCICTPKAFYEMTYKQKKMQEDRVVHSKAKFKVESGDGAFLRLGVCEWVCVLWGDVTLSNTLSQCLQIAASLGHRYALGRQEAWGFMVCSADSDECLRIKASYTKSEKMKLSLHEGEKVTNLQEVAAYDECSFVSYSADAALARDTAELCVRIAREEATLPVNVIVINDTTCGALCTELSKIENLHISVSFTPEWQKTHAVTEDVVESIVPHATTKIECEQFNSRKRMRDTRKFVAGRMTQRCIVVLPELFYMSKNYARRVDFYRNLLGNSNGIRTIPDLETTSSKGFTYSSRMEVAPSSCATIMSTLREVGGLSQILNHPHVHFSTREFPALAFLEPPGECNDCFEINFHEVRGEWPSANLRTLRALVEKGDIPSLSARMISGSGLIARVGIDNTTNCHDVSLDEGSSSEEDDI